MNSTFTDTREAVTGLTLKRGSEIISLTFPTGDPNTGTFHALLAALVDGYVMADYQTTPIHKLPK